MKEYIEREALKNAIYADGNLTAYLEYIINRIPAADVREVRHGRWAAGDMPTYGGYKCSVCGGNTVHYKANFCPNCGAEMKGEASDV